jgi:hypothetical protein
MAGAQYPSHFLCFLLLFFTYHGSMCFHVAESWKWNLSSLPQSTSNLSLPDFRKLKLREVKSLPQVRQPVVTGLGLLPHQMLPWTIPAPGWGWLHTVQGAAVPPTRSVLCSAPCLLLTQPKSLEKPNRLFRFWFLFFQKCVLAVSLLSMIYLLSVS